MHHRRHLTAARGLCALAAFAMAAATAAAQEPLTLEDAVKIALERNRSVSVAALQVERAEQRVAAAKTRRYPSLELQATAGSTLNTIKVSYPAGAFGTYPGIGPIPTEDTVVESPPSLSGNLNATLAQPLSQLHRIGLNVKANELGREIEQEKLREERAAIVAEVRSLYYELVQRESTVRAKEEQVGALRELDRVVARQLAVEAALRSDALEVRSRLASEEYALAGLQGDLATARERMNLLLGRDLDTAISVAGNPELAVEEADLPAALAQALQHRPDLAQARLAVDQADTDRRMKKAESIPDLSLAVTYYTFVNVDLIPHNIALAGLQLKWEPFDWGRRGKETAEKALQVEQARRRAREAEDRVRIEVADRFRKLQQARMLVDAERLSREAASERLRIITARHRQDAALLKDLLEAQSSMSAAHARFDGALLTFWTARADFQKALGQE